MQAFSSVNIEDSRRMKNLAEVSVRDSAGMLRKYDEICVS